MLVNLRQVLRPHTKQFTAWDDVPPRQLMALTHHLVFHAGENDIQHLRKGSLGSGLIDEIFAGQIDIVTCPNSL